MREERAGGLQKVRREDSVGFLCLREKKRGTQNSESRAGGWGRCAGRARSEQGNRSNPRSKDKSHEALAKIQVKNDHGLNQIGSDRETVGF